MGVEARATQTGTPNAPAKCLARVAGDHQVHVLHDGGRIVKIPQTIAEVGDWCLTIQFTQLFMARSHLQAVKTNAAHVSQTGEMR